MQSKHTRVALRRNDLEKRVARAGGIVPLVISNLLFADVADGMMPARGPERKTRCGGEPFDDVRIDCLLKHDEVRIYRVDCFREWLLAAVATEANVVTEQLQRHASSSGWTTT